MDLARDPRSVCKLGRFAASPLLRLMGGGANESVEVDEPDQGSPVLGADDCSEDSSDIATLESLVASLSTRDCLDSNATAQQDVVNSEQRPASTQAHSRSTSEITEGPQEEAGKDPKADDELARHCEQLTLGESPGPSGQRGRWRGRGGRGGRAGRAGNQDERARQPQSIAGMGIVRIGRNLSGAARGLKLVVLDMNGLLVHRVKGKVDPRITLKQAARPHLPWGGGRIEGPLATCKSSEYPIQRRCAQL